MTYSTGFCQKCEQNALLVPLHGAAGGPLLCPICAGAWQAEHGRRRRAGRVVIRAIKAFEAAGGKHTDLSKLCASSLDGFAGLTIDPLGYLAGIGKTEDEVIELTSELLADAIRLTHPDCHPPERQDLARRVTAQLLELKPFVFPAPPPKEAKPAAPAGPRSSRADALPAIKQTYPCAECRSTIPYFYCTTCKIEWDKQQEAKRVIEREKRRRWRANSKARRRGWKPRLCETCGMELSDNRRIDIRFCSATCRQRGHRKSVTAKSTPPMRTLLSVTTIGGAP